MEGDVVGLQIGSLDKEIQRVMEEWAEKKTDELLSIYAPQRYAVSEENKAKWDRIERFGFHKCGNIYVKGGAERIAYDYIS